MSKLSQTQKVKVSFADHTNYSKEEIKVNMSTYQNKPTYLNTKTKTTFP